MFDVSKFSLNGKVAIVTGGSRGIGKAIAGGLAKAGARVIITSRKVADLESTAAEIKAAGGDVVPVGAHLGKLDEIAKLMAFVTEKYRTVDILVNNAGGSPVMASVLDSDERAWDTIMNLNLRGLYFMSQAAAKLMKAKGWGRIINVSSVDGHKPEPGLSLYSISKAAVLMVTKTFAMELAPFGITVNAISPGPIATKMLNSHWDHLPPEQAQAEKNASAKKMLMGRIGEPDEIAGAALYLASDASSYTTGAEIVIDGGVLLQPTL